MSAPRRRILYLEDDEDSRELVCMILTSEGYESICTASSEDALELAEAQRFDVYLLDCWMPGLSGIEVCKRIREFDARTPIVFHSAAAYQSDIDAAIEAGAQGYIIKPSTPEEIIRALRLAIAQSLARSKN